MNPPLIVKTSSSFYLFIVISLILTTHSHAKPKKCTEGCTKYGNCNQDTGKCECPFGRSGSKCQHDHLSACRPTPDSPAYCGHVSLKPCECIRQCHRYLCHPDEQNNVICDTLSFMGLERTCFERPKLGKKQIYEHPKEDEPDVVYYKGFFNDSRQEIDYKSATINTEAKQQSLPLDNCQDRCNERGACIKYIDSDMAPFCTCYHGYDGTACEIQHNVCPNQCSTRGTCTDSFCHCNEGYWGLSCQNSEPAVDESKIPNPADFKIYMYDLPASVAYQQAYWAGWQYHHSIYTAYQHFLDQLVSSPYLTHNPYEAHLFFIPAFTYAFTSNLGHPDFHVTRVIQHIKQHHPFWNMSGGKDHMVWTPGDRSSCLLESHDAQALIKLTHFGYFDNNANGKYHTFLSGVNPKWGCYHPLRDVVMPPRVDGAGVVANFTFDEERRKNYVQKSRLMFFAGGIRPDDHEYAGGARAMLTQWLPKWKHGHGIEIVDGFVPDYDERLRSSKFCLAPYGHGWGIRIVSAMITGCVPVIIQEHVFQPYEEILPYEEFSIRLNNNDIPRLPEILNSIDDERLARMQKAVEVYWPAFVWPTGEGGKAFEYGMMALRRRYLNYKSLYYGRHEADLFK